MNDNSQIKTLRHDMRLLARKMELMTKGEASCCGLVSRTTDPDNRRAVTITLTDEGQKLFAQVEASMTQFYETFYNALPADKRSQILESLELLLTAIPAGRWC
ncbi:MAG: winged helix-turn-helix transcriptional regulator [Anaerospora sp.]|nr:winged helix-turn-helix transcriptional regulator [Anaerospora sp.]